MFRITNYYSSNFEHVSFHFSAIYFVFFGHVCAVMYMSLWWRFSKHEHALVYDEMNSKPHGQDNWIKNSSGNVSFWIKQHEHWFEQLEDRFIVHLVRFAHLPLVDENNFFLKLFILRCSRGFVVHTIFIGFFSVCSMLFSPLFSFPECVCSPGDKRKTKSFYVMILPYFHRC